MKLQHSDEYIVLYFWNRIENEKKKQQFRSVLSGLHDFMLDHACGLVVTLHLLSIVFLRSFLTLLWTVYVCESELGSC